MATKKAVTNKATSRANRTPLVDAPPDPTTPNPDAIGAVQRGPRAKLIEDEEQVMVNVPKGFILTLDTGHPITYAAGAQEMPASHADHWYAKANGVELAKK